MKMNRNAPVFIIAEGPDRTVSLPAALSCLSQDYTAPLRRIPSVSHRCRIIHAGNLYAGGPVGRMDNLSAADIHTYMVDSASVGV